MCDRTQIQLELDSPVFIVSNLTAATESVGIATCRAQQAKIVEVRYCLK